MFKLDLEKAEKLEIKLPTSIASQVKQENSRGGEKKQKQKQKQQQQQKKLLLLHWLC